MRKVKELLLCYHCGADCQDDSIHSDDKLFCCEGCKLVYEILQENNLCTYYTLNNNPGLKLDNSIPINRFSFLDEKTIQNKLIYFRDKNKSYVTFQIPHMHCTSCIWLLENLSRINNGVISSRVDFLKKEMSLVFDESITTLRKVVEHLTRIGYEPSIHLDSVDEKKVKVKDKSRIYRIGVAGFCLGNIMMLSFPEYFSSGKIIEPGLKTFFSYLNLSLALPVFFFCSSEFFVNAWKSLKQKLISIDVPIALGILAMFTRSSYEILSHTGTGYFDSMAGLVFFMLVGRKFQDYTFDSISFDRDYKSYFPVAVSVINNGIENSLSVHELKVNDRFIIRCNEIVPVDALLLEGYANIDYSFVTGESAPRLVKEGEIIFAGGKQTGSIIELKVLKEVSESHITQLWNRRIVKAEKNRFQKIITVFSQWFIIITFLIAAIAGIYWFKSDVHRAINAFTAVLIIACPCAFSLSAPFTFGNVLRILGKNKIYFKNTDVIQKVADVDTIVFDKTGTLTDNSNSGLTFIGDELTIYEKQLIFSLSRQSSHPLSQKICKSFTDIKPVSVENYIEKQGEGVEGIINGIHVKSGSLKFIGEKDNPKLDVINKTRVYVSFDGVLKGCFILKNQYRSGIEKIISQLKDKSYDLFVLSGDNDSEEINLRKLFGKKAELLFNQSPADKLNYILSLQRNGKKVMMVGDGLNDAGALMQSDIGISISADVNNFSPASDGIIDSSGFRKIPFILKYSKTAITIIIWSFIFSMIYNFIGLSLAVRGILSPVIAAILMPVSTVSLVLFTVIASSFAGRKIKKIDIDENHFNR